MERVIRISAGVVGRKSCFAANMRHDPRPTTHNPRSPRGFTLIELLTVIGIIAILAGIISVAVNVVSNNASARRTRVAIENAMGMQKEYENATPLVGQLKTGSVNASGSCYDFTPSAIGAFSRVPANKSAMEKMASNTIGPIAATDFAVYAAAKTYAIGDIVQQPAASGTLYSAIAATTGNAPPDPTYWVLYTANVIVPVDGWGKPIAYVPTSLTNLNRAGVTATANTASSPNSRPFWVSAGPDGAFQTHDDNVYSFEN